MFQLRSTFATGLVFLFAVPALAQDSTPTPSPAPTPVEEFPVEEREASGEMVVTGTRIKRKDLTTPAPVTIIDREALQKSGKSTIGEVLQAIPAQSNAINIQFNNGGDGSTRVNLRGLASNRTLVLVNGRRHVPGGTGANSSVDLNAIPTAIIERVEILKDGASAVYGSDAVGGVVNIITRTDFQGAEFNAYTGTTADGLAAVADTSFVVGQTTQRGHIVFSAGVAEQKPMGAGARGFSATDRFYDWETGLVYANGSTATPMGYINDRTGEPGNDAWDKVVKDGQGDTTFYNDPATGWRPFNFDGNSDTGGGDLYNYQPENYLVTPQKRFNVYSSGSLLLGEQGMSRGYFEASFVNRKSEQKLAPTPLFIISEGLAVSADNAYNPFGRDFYDVRRRFVEADNRLFTQDLSTYRFVGGFDGEMPYDWKLGGGWFWDVSFNYGLTQGTDFNEGRFIRSAVEEALGPSHVDADGRLRCGTVDNPGADDCVPLNLFGGAGTITDEMLSYISYNGTAKGFTEQRIASATLGGELFRLWRGPVDLAAGVQHRQERGGYEPDPMTASGNTTGNKGESTNGGYYVSSAYAELSWRPLTNLPGLRFFEIDAATRAMNYSTFGFHNTWKLGSRAQVLKSLALRGTMSTAFRAPSIGELYSGTSDSFPAVTDPCDTSQGPRNPTVEANCASDGLPSDYVDDRAQIRSLVGGNPNLKPETADVVTAGVVFEPAGVAKGLSMTVDYFDIEIQNSIQPAGASVILSNCYNQTDRSNCDQIVRNEQGFITVILDTETNIGAVRTSGLDFSAHYDHTTRAGRFLWKLDGTWLNDYSEVQADGRKVAGKGVYDLGVFPEWKLNLGTIWGYKGLGAGLNMRYIDAFKECEDNDCSGEAPLTRNVEAYATMDAFASYKVKHRLGATDLALGVNNILDRQPARIYNGFLATSDASTYDFLGRYFYLRLSHAL